MPAGLSGERKLLSVVDAQPAARGIVSTVLRDVYLAESVTEAAEKQRQHASASFVTPEGVLVGPAVIHTAKEADARAREIRAELPGARPRPLRHDERAQPARQRLGEISGGNLLPRRADRGSGRRDHGGGRADVAPGARSDGHAEGKELHRQRLTALDETVDLARERLAALGPVSAEPMPDLPPTPQAPVQQRVAVEALRRERGFHDGRVRELRAEREELSAHDPTSGRTELEAAERGREEAELAIQRIDDEATRVAAARDATARAEREAAEHEAAVNKAWRDAAGELDRLRETYEDEDRTRGDIERRIRETERLIREGYQSEPDELLTSLTEDDSVESLEKKSEMVQRRLALLGRVNLLATGEFEVVRERHDFMARELDEVRRARRDLLEVIARVDQEMTETFSSAYRDVALQFERLVRELPGGEGRRCWRIPAEPLTSGIEIEASPGRKRVQRVAPHLTGSAAWCGSVAGGSSSRPGRQNQQPLLLRPQPRGVGEEPVQVTLITPHIDWFGLSPVLTLIGTSFASLICAVLVPPALRRLAGAGIALAGFTAGIVLAVWLYVDTPDGHTIAAGAYYRDRWTSSVRSSSVPSASRRRSSRSSTSQAGRAAPTRRAATITSPSSTRSCSRRQREWRSSSAPRT